MNGTLAWILVALGLGVVMVWRRSLAVGFLTVQALILVGVALGAATSADEVFAAAALGRAGVRAGDAVPGARRAHARAAARARGHRAARPCRRRRRARAASDLARAGDRPHRPNTERAVIALVAFGLVTTATRRATLFQVMGVVLVENALALAALELPGVSSLAIELGVALDLTLIVLVAAVFHERIFAEFGSGDTAALRSLRD